MLREFVFLVFVISLQAGSGFSQMFKCPKPDGLFGKPKNCRRFYICHSGYPFEASCPPSLYFDDIRKICVYKNKYLVCGPVEYPTEAPTTVDPLAAIRCDSTSCRLPECFCSSDGSKIPNSLEPEEIPQMVLLTFGGAVNPTNSERYHTILNETRVNPDFCPIKATFFVPHEYTSYYEVHQLYAAGHEIGMMSISQRDPEEYWVHANHSEWTEEIVGAREILHHFGQIPRDHMLGVRAPFLKVGGNAMMGVVYDYGLDYDSSIAVTPRDIPAWPYTLDHRMPHGCLSDNCPTRSFPGIWEIPLNSLFSSSGVGGQCVLLDQCVFPSNDEDSILEFLEENFRRHYTTNRAPFALNVHVTWVTDPVKVAVMEKFIDMVLENYTDTWFVTVQQLLDWMREPTRLQDLPNFAGWACEHRDATCSKRTCHLDFPEDKRQPSRYMEVCTGCPARYPWVGYFDGSSSGKKIADIVNAV